MITQLLHRFDGHRIRRYVLLRPFGPAVELGELDEPPELPPYDAEADLAPRRPQMWEYTLHEADFRLPRITPPLATGCDRSGACCTQYPVIATTMAERKRALVTLRRQEDEWSLPIDPEETFAPAYPGATEPLTPVFVGDGCAFLGPQGCGIHAIGGPQAKPLTCRQYPLQVIHDGEQLELSILPQCACAVRCTQPGNAEDWPHDLVTSFHTVPQVPEEIVVDAQRLLPRSAYLSWVRALADVLATPTEEPSVLRVLDDAAQSLRLPAVDIPHEWLELLEERALDEADRLQSYLPATNPQVSGLRWVAELASSLLDPDAEGLPVPLEDGRDGPVLALALRAHVLLELPSLAAALVDLVRLVRLAALSRRIGHAQTLDPRLEPLPLLLYLWATTKWPVSSERRHSR